MPRDAVLHHVFVFDDANPGCCVIVLRTCRHSGASGSEPHRAGKTAIETLMATSGCGVSASGASGAANSVCCTQTRPAASQWPCDG